MKTSRAIVGAALLGLASASCSTGQSATLGTSTTSAPTTAPTGTKYLITFGDSYSQTGFNINSTKPSAANPIGNPPLPGWTASGGLNWVGFLASRLNTSLLLAYNFAYGGATTSADLVKPYEPTVLSFVDQVREFSASVAAKPDYAPWTADDALFGVWIGVNDVGNTFWLGNVSETNLKIMDVYFAQLQTLYDAGARRFAILSVPPIEKTPAQLAQGSDWSTETEARVIGEYNALLAARLASFTQANAGIIDAKIVDTQAPFNAALADPAKYGAPNATCYNADGVSCLWFNDYHPGVRINELVAEAVFEEFKGSFF